MIPSRSLPRNVCRVGLATLSLTTGTALMVWAFGASAWIRRLLGFEFDVPAQRPGEALGIAATNLRLVAALLLAALVVRRRPQLRRPLDATLGAVLALNGAVLGIALGAYGSRLVEAVALHGPLELAAFAVAGGAYTAAGAAEISAGAFAAMAFLAVTLVAAGAVVETYVQIGGGA